MTRLQHTGLRLAHAARNTTARALQHLETRMEQAKAKPDRGDVNIPTVIWIVGGVVFAVAALAAFKVIAAKHLTDMQGL